MTDCLEALTLVEDMVELIRTTKEGERGFVACKKETLEIGARCSGDDNHCTLVPPACPSGGRPVVSFHTHATKASPMTLLLGEDPFVGENAKAVLLPSSKDLAADVEVGVDVGCIGGRLNDGTALVWCFRSFLDATPTERDIARAQVELLQERVREALKNPAERGTLLASVLQDYLESVAKPCLELRLPIPA